MKNNSEIELSNMAQKPSAPSEYTLQKNVEFNGKIYSYFQSFHLLSQKEQDELKDSPWFQAGLPRQISLEILLQCPPGAFLVRQSETAKNCFALSMRVPNVGKSPKLSHYLIEKTRNGYRFHGFIKEFPTIKSLVVHHSIIKGHLPIPLLFSRAQDFAMRNLVVDQPSSSSDNESDLGLDKNRNKNKKTTSCFCKK